MLLPVMTSNGIQKRSFQVGGGGEEVEKEKNKGCENAGIRSFSILTTGFLIYILPGRFLYFQPSTGLSTLELQVLKRSYRYRH